MKSLKPLLALAVVLTLLSSCKKSDPTYANILTSHKWSVTAATNTYDDSTGVSHNLIATTATCVPDVYTEFRDYTSSNPVRLAYQYIISTCPGFTTPTIGTSAWDLDKDNANLYMGGDVNNTTNQVTGGQWFTIVTLNSSTIVLTYKHQEVIGSTGGSNPHSIYHTVTQTITYSAR